MLNDYPKDATVTLIGTHLVLDGRELVNCSSGLTERAQN